MPRHEHSPHNALLFLSLLLRKIPMKSIVSHKIMEVIQQISKIPEFGDPQHRCRIPSSKVRNLNDTVSRDKSGDRLAQHIIRLVSLDGLTYITKLHGLSRSLNPRMCNENVQNLVYECRSLPEFLMPVTTGETVLVS